MVLKKIAPCAVVPFPDIGIHAWLVHCDYTALLVPVLVPVPLDGLGRCAPARQQG